MVHNVEIALAQVMAQESQIYEQNVHLIEPMRGQFGRGARYYSFYIAQVLILLFGSWELGTAAGAVTEI